MSSYKESKICRLKDFSKSSRSEEDKNVFNSFEEASGSLGLSMLSQQLADVISSSDSPNSSK
jgi:hypothetical protein